MLISLIIIWDSVISLITKKVQSNDLINSLKIKLNQNFYIPVLFFATGVILFVTSSGFKDVSAERGMSSINITYDLFREFSTIFIDKYIINIKEPLIIFILLFFTAVYFAFKNKDLKPILFSTMYIISIYSVMLSLVLCGKSNGDHFFLEHENIPFLYSMLLMIPFAVILSFIYKNIKKLLYIFIPIIIILFGFMNINFISQRNDTFENHTFMIEQLYYKKIINYINEKITRFYFLNNKTAIIQANLYYFSSYLQPEDGFKENENYCFYEKNQLIFQYERIYKTTPDVQPYFCIKHSALDDFYDNGGYITKEEVKKLDFNRLFDENYVLKKKENETNEIYTPKEINEIIKKIVL